MSHEHLGLFDTPPDRRQVRLGLAVVGAAEVVVGAAEVAGLEVVEGAAEVVGAVVDEVALQPTDSSNAARMASETSVIRALFFT